MAPRSRGRELLDAAVRYALANVALVTPRLLSRPTPCSDWDLELLLDHLAESMAVLHEAVATGGVAAHLAPAHPTSEPDSVARLRTQAANLLAAWAVAGPALRSVSIAGRELAAGTVALTGAIETTVHGWDIGVACGAYRPVPPGLATILAPIAPLLITPGIRPGLFADPVMLPGPDCPGDQLIAFLGRRPLLAAARA